MSFLKFGNDIKGKNNSQSQTSDSSIFQRFICHRIPERTFNVRGYYFPVCSRCTGLYIGVFLCFMYITFFYVFYTFDIILIAILMILPTLVDGVTQFFGVRESNNILRFFTGLIGGVGIVILINAIKWMIIMN